MAENNISSAAILLKARTSEMERGLDKAKGMLGKFAAGAKSIFDKISFAIPVPVVGKFLSGLTDSLEDWFKDSGRQISSWIGGLFDKDKRTYVKIGESIGSNIAEGLDRAIEQAEANFQTAVRNRIDKIKQDTSDMGKSPMELAIAKVRRELDPGGTGRREKEIQAVTEALQTQQKIRDELAATEKQIAGIERERQRDLEESARLIEQFKDPATKLADRIMRLRWLENLGPNFGGIGKDVFEKAAAAARAEFMPAAEVRANPFRFAPGDQLGSREAAEAMIRSRFNGERRPGGDPIEKVVAEEKRGNELLKGLTNAVTDGFRNVVNVLPDGQFRFNEL